MALVVSVSYSMRYANSTDNTTSPGNLGSILRLRFTPGSASQASFSSTVSATVDPGLVSNEDVDTSMKNLSRQEYMQGILAGEQAMSDRLFADMIAAQSPLPSLSAESRHRHAVNTCRNVSELALAAVGEIAATRKIENMR